MKSDPRCHPRLSLAIALLVVVAFALLAGCRSGQKKAVYTCPMHPDIQVGEPGKCPECGMNLVRDEPTPAPPRNAGSDSAHSGTAHSGTSK